MAIVWREILQRNHAPRRASKPEVDAAGGGSGAALTKPTAERRQRAVAGTISNKPGGTPLAWRTKEGGKKTMPSDCYACRLTAGTESLPGGRILATEHWVVEHCTGPLGVGTLIVKPFRHCVHVGDLTAPEAQELGPLLKRVSQVTQALTHADQVYVCLWSHSGWQPVHIHFVVQPAWNRWRDTHGRPGPFVQSVMFQTVNTPPAGEVEAICLDAKKLLGRSE